jgi:hypothetical protein
MRERLRKHSVTNLGSAKDLSELETYLNKISLDDLINLKTDRKSTKNLEGGPMISGRLVQSGLVKKGYSVPHTLLLQEDKIHGTSSFHGQNYTEIKDII